jgi:xylan 1,4-beta-xylosidase
MIKLETDPAGKPLRAPWRQGIAMGRAYEMLRSDAREHLRFVQRELGFQWCRFHGLFHEDMAVVARRRDGRLIYQWSQVDVVLDFLLSIGLRPFVELNPMPSALASAPSSMFAWNMNVSPPRSYEEWGALVEAFARHCVDRYGLEEVRRWHFEVWNEPNLDCFWKGDQAEYWRLYDASAFAVKRVDTGLRIGGPATARAEWVVDLINHCTGEKVPLDFVSTHRYPQDEFVIYPNADESPHEPGDFLITEVRRVRADVRASIRPELPVYWTEWNSLACKDAKSVTWINNRAVDDLSSGSSVARYSLELDDASDGMAWWVASDIFEETGMPMSPFSETYGLLTIHGLPKPSFHAFTFLSRLRGPRMHATSQVALPHGCGLVATEEERVIRCLLYNQKAPSVVEPATWHGELEVPWPDKECLVVAFTVKEGAGSARETWEQLGAPHNLGEIELAMLRAAANPAYQFERILAVDGLLGWRFTLEPNEIAYFEFRCVGESYEPKGGAKQSSIWDAGMGTGISA